MCQTINERVSFLLIVAAVTIKNVGMPQHVQTSWSHGYIKATKKIKEPQGTKN